jgi:hypothetical protein
MAWSAENIESFPTSLKNFLGYRKRHDIAWIAADLAGVEVTVRMQLAARDRALDQRTRGTLIGIEIAARKRILARLHVHVDAAGGGQRDQHDKARYRHSWNPTLAHKTRKDGAPGKGNRRRASLDWTGEGARPHIGFATT